MSEEEYILLIHKHLTHQITHDEQERLDRWLDESFQHRQIFEEVKMVWEDEGHYPPLTESERRTERSQLLRRITADVRRSPPSPVRRSAFIFGVAAVLLLGMTFAAGYFFLLSDPPLSRTIQVAHQKNTSVMLPDSTTVQVGTNSTLSFPSVFEERTVQLQGEAFFDVTSDPTRPFLVVLPEATLQVVGTSFRVRAYPEETRTVVSVLSGQVSVYNEYDTLRVEAGQQSTFDRQQHTWVLSDETNPTAFGKQSNQLTFDGVSLENILAALEDRHNVTFVVENPDLLACQFTGSFGPEQLHKILEILSFSLQFDYRYQDHQYIIQGSGCP